MHSDSGCYDSATMHKRSLYVYSIVYPNGETLTFCIYDGIIKEAYGH